VYPWSSRILALWVFAFAPVGTVIIWDALQYCFLYTLINVVVLIENLKEKGAVFFGVLL
jgi:hypothetical protein